MVNKFDETKSLAEIEAELEEEAALLEAKRKVFESRKIYEQDLEEYESRFKVEPEEVVENAKPVEVIFFAIILGVVIVIVCFIAYLFLK